MPNYIVQGSDLSSVAGAIRTKGDTSEQLAFPAGFVSAIDALPTGGGGAQTIASGTFTGAGNNHCVLPVGKKMPQCDFIFLMYAPNNTQITGVAGTDRYFMAIQLLSLKKICEYDLSSDGTISATGKFTYYVDNAGTIKTYPMGANAGKSFLTRMTTTENGQPNPKIIRDSSGFSLDMGAGSAQYFFPAGISYNWELFYFGSDPDNDIVEVP